MGALGNNVERTARVQRADGDDHRLRRCNFAARNRLEQRYKLGGSDDRIDRFLGHRAVAAAADQLDVETIGGRKESAVADSDLAGVEPAVEMEREGAVDVRVFERPVRDHLLVAGEAFFARLKTEDKHARDLFPAAVELARRSQQHRHVSIVAARVHDARFRRAIRRVVELFDRKRVHIGAQQRCGPILAASQRREYARLSNGGTNFVKSKAAQLALDEGRRLTLLHRELRLRVKVTAISNELVVTNHGLLLVGRRFPTSGRRIWLGQRATTRRGHF